MKRLAIITPGGIGAGINGQGFPALVQIMTHLSKSYEVEVFSHAFVTNEVETIKFHFAPQWIPGMWRWGYLKLSLLKNHFKNRYDLLFAFWGYPSGALAVGLGMLMNRPSMVYLLGGESANLLEINYGLMRHWFTRKMVLKTCQHASVVFALSNFQVGNLRRYGVNRKIEIIPFGVDKKLFAKSEKKQSDVLKIIHVANITPVKDQATLIRSFNLIRDQINARLKIVGPDFMNGQIQKMTRELKVDGVEFVGWKSYEEIPRLLAESDCFMLTSMSEAQNDAITEGMMCGLLPISTRVGIMADLGGDYGVVCEVGDHESLAEQLVSICRDRQQWNEKVEKSHAWAMEHDLNWTLNKIVAQIELVFNPKA